MADDTRRVRHTATDTPDRYPEVDEQLLADYPELRTLIEQQKAGGR